jgi:drug/metabolite transporter (DMT)-like permease
MSQQKGFLLVLLTAIVSGASIFANSFAVKGFDASVFTFLKNALVAIFLFSIILLLKELPLLKRLSKRQWAQLALIGLIGGSIPFLLFFQALQLTTAINAGFVHKTLFIWASIFAIVFLKEKIDKRFLLAAVLLLAGNFAFFGISSFGLPEAMILAATILWAAELAISKKALSALSGATVAFGRMFFGSIFILAFLALTGQAIEITAVSAQQAQWLLASSAFLLAYAFTFYSGLKILPVHKAAALMLIAQPITIAFSLAFFGTTISTMDAFGFLLVIAGTFLAFGLGFFLNKNKTKVPQIAPERN